MLPCSLNGYMVHPLIENSSQKCLQCPCRLKCINIREAQSQMNDSVHFIQIDPKALGHTNDSMDFILMNPKEQGHTNDS